MENWWTRLTPRCRCLIMGFFMATGLLKASVLMIRACFVLNEHIDRLYETMHTLMIDPQMTKKQMSDAVMSTLKANKIKDGYIRLIVSRGEGDLGLDPRKCFGKPNVIIIADKITLYPAELYQKGMEIITVPTVKNHPNALKPQLKSLNYLKQYFSEDGSFALRL